MSGWTVDRNPMIAVAVLAATALALFGCAATAVPTASAPEAAVVVTANNVAFEQQTVTAPAGETFEIYFENREPVPHNVHVLDASGASIMQGEVFNGPSARVHPMPALAPGRYRILCDVHPNMTAELVAQP